MHLCDIRHDQRMYPTPKSLSPTEGAIILLRHITDSRLHGTPGPAQLPPAERALIIQFAEGLGAYSDPCATAQLGDYATQRAKVATDLAAHLAIADGPGQPCPFSSRVLVESYHHGAAELLESDHRRKPYTWAH